MTPRDAVRLTDVAKHAGVTVSTVSRALARPEMVRLKTRQRVEQAAAELGYEPNRAARSLITGRTGVIAILVPDLANTYFAHIARAAQEFARARDYKVLIERIAAEHMVQVIGHLVVRESTGPPRPVARTEE